MQLMGVTDTRTGGTYFPLQQHIIRIKTDDFSGTHTKKRVANNTGVQFTNPLQ